MKLCTNTATKQKHKLEYRLTSTLTWYTCLAHCVIVSPGMQYAHKPSNCSPIPATTATTIEGRKEKPRVNKR
jgi:hypothetical protein